MIRKKVGFTRETWTKIKTRVALICTILGLKISFLVLIIDFGHEYYACAKYVLAMATESAYPIPIGTTIEDLCYNFTWSLGIQSITALVIGYLLVDCVVYVCLFIAEERRPRKRVTSRHCDGYAVRDKNGEIFPNFWADEAAYEMKCLADNKIPLV